MEDPIIYISLSLIILLIVLKLSLQTTQKPRYKNLPPSPPALPVIGHLHLLEPVLHRALHRLSTKYGSGNILFLRFGSRRVVVVSSPSAVEECFTKNDIALANRPHLLAGKHIQYNNTTMGAAHYGDHWCNLRRIGAIEIFSSSRLNMFLGIRRDEVKRLMLRINRSSLLSDRRRVELKPAFSHLTLNVITRMVAGKRYYDEDVTDEGDARQFREIVAEIFENSGVANPADFLPIMNWIPQGYEKRLKRLAKRTDVLFQRLIDEHRSRDESRNTMIDHLLSLQESQPEYYTDQIIKGFVLVLLLAGNESLALTLEWVMSNLLNHPEVLKKAKVEIDTQVGQHHLVEESDISKLYYLQNIISETLRLCPVGPLLAPHYSVEDCTISGYDVPRDTMLLVNAWAIHRDPKLWDDPESFRPERFKKSENNRSEQYGYKLMPFGLGRRACPGVGLAQRVVGLTLGSLIQCFEWERIGAELVDMTEGKGLAMPKAVPLEAICKARPIMNIVDLSESVDSF